MEPSREELNAIPSIYDGWEKQIFYKSADDGGYCARGFVIFCSTFSTSMQRKTEWRIGSYIQQHYPLPGIYAHPEGPLHPRARADEAIIYANNELKLTPDTFRYIDRLTQWQEMQKQVDAMEPEAVLV